MSTNDLNSLKLDNNNSSLSNSSLHIPSNSNENEGFIINKDQLEGSRKKKREVFRYKTDWLVSSLAWSNEQSEAFDLAVSSYIEEYTNWVQLINLSKDDYDEEIESVYAFKHPYPATKILWNPCQPGSTRLSNLIATSADYLRLWRVEKLSQRSEQNDNSVRNELCSDNKNHFFDDTEVRLECLLNSNQGTKHCAPLTSFDWNEIDPSIIVTSSVDTTCAIWDIETGQLTDKITSQKLINSSPQTASDSNLTCNLRSQIVAHNHEVYDVSFSRSGSGRDVFVTAGGDGSVRLFDLRRLSISTMLYEADRVTSSDNQALVRVCCNKQDSNLVSAFAINSKDILILDLRNPGKPLLALSSHTASINSTSWAAHSAYHICSASDDQQALIWELSKLPQPVEEPLLAYRANGKINSISWSNSHPDWIAIGFENYVELLRV